MSGVEELVAKMRSLGIRRLRVGESDLDIELEPSPPAEALPHPATAPDVDPTLADLLVNAEQDAEYIARGLSVPAAGKCQRCRKAEPAGLVPGHCRDCGRDVIRGN